MTSDLSVIARTLYIDYWLIVGHFIPIHLSELRHRYCDRSHDDLKNFALAHDYKKKLHCQKPCNLHRPTIKHKRVAPILIIMQVCNLQT